jgi:hypothetical protein
MAVLLILIPNFLFLFILIQCIHRPHGLSAGTLSLRRTIYEGKVCPTDVDQCKVPNGNVQEGEVRSSEAE